MASPTRRTPGGSSRNGTDKVTGCRSRRVMTLLSDRPWAGLIPGFYRDPDDLGMARVIPLHSHTCALLGLRKKAYCNDRPWEIGDIEDGRSTRAEGGSWRAHRRGTSGGTSAGSSGRAVASAFPTANCSSDSRRRDESAEAAFETILARHGSLVLTVCRQVLGDAHAAEDAFQATFLVLVRRAGSMRVREPGTLGPWLHGVAYRTALKARQGAGRRRARERRAAVPDVGRPPPPRSSTSSSRRVLHEEVNRLPAKYRAPVVLCYFEGRTHDEAAAALDGPSGRSAAGWPGLATGSGHRLTRRGLAPAGWIGASLLEPAVRIEPPARLLETTVAATIKGTPAQPSARWPTSCSGVCYWPGSG